MDIPQTLKEKLAAGRVIPFVDVDIYHIGASLKDLGKKWFAFSKMAVGAIEMLQRVNGLYDSDQIHDR